MKLEGEGQEFAKIMRSLNQFIQTVKGQNIFFLIEIPNQIYFKRLKIYFQHGPCVVVPWACIQNYYVLRLNARIFRRVHV